MLLNEKHGDEIQKLQPSVMIPIVYSRDTTFMFIFEQDGFDIKCNLLVEGQEKLIIISKIENVKLKDLTYCGYQGNYYISFGPSNPVYELIYDPEKIMEQDLSHIINENWKQIFTIKEFAVSGTKYQGTDTFDTIVRNEPVIENLNNVLRTKLSTSFVKIQSNTLAMFNGSLWCLGLSDNVHGIYVSSKYATNDFHTAYKSLLEARNPLNALSLTFSSGIFDRVLWAAPFVNDLLVGTTDGIYILQEGDRTKNEFIKIRREIDISVSKVKPVVVGKTLFFVEGDQRKINSLYYSREKGGYHVSCVTTFAEHLFSSRIKQLVGVSSPFNMVFAVLEEGNFAIFVFDQENKIMGWTEHWLGGEGLVQEACTLQGKHSDKVFFRVQRTCKDEEDTPILKEFLESLDCKYLTAKYSNTPHEPLYADCYSHILRGQDIEIDKVFEEIFENKEDANCDRTKKEQRIIEKFYSSRAFSDEEIKQNFIIKGILVEEIENPEEQRQVIKVIKEYFATYREKIFEILGLNYAVGVLAEQVLGYCTNIFLGHLEFKDKVIPLINDLKKIKKTIGENIKLVKNWDISAVIQKFLYSDIFSIKDDMYGFSLITIKNIKEREEQEIEYFIIDLEQLYAASSSYVNNMGTKLQSIKNEEMKKAIINFNNEFLRFFAENTKPDISQYISMQQRGDYVEHERIKRLYLLENILNKGFGELFFDTLQKQFNINNYIDFEGITTEQAKEWINNVLPVILKEICRSHIVDIKRCLPDYSQEIVILFKSFLLSFPLVKEVAKKEVDKMISEIVPELITQNEEVLNDIISRCEKELRHEQQGGLQIEEQKTSLLELVVDDYLSKFPRDVTVESFINMLSSKTSGGITELDFFAHLFFDLFINIHKSIKTFNLRLYDLYNQLVVKRIAEQALGRRGYLTPENELHISLFYSKEYFPLWRKLFPDVELETIKTLIKLSIDSTSFVPLKGMEMYKNLDTIIIGDEEIVYSGKLEGSYQKLNKSAYFVSIGFPYKSVLTSFPFVFPEEVEHTPKKDAQIGIKFYNTKGGTLEVDGEKYQVNTPAIDILSLDHYTSEKKYLIKEIANCLSTPYKTGWVNFDLTSEINKEISFIFTVDKPHPATILKAYAKAKILPHYK